MIIIPVSHENMEARRWPVITIALIAINVIIFILTYKTLENDVRKISEIKRTILYMAANYPDLNVQPESRLIVEGFKQSNPDGWKRLVDTNPYVWKVLQDTRYLLNATSNDNKTEKDKQEYYAALQSEMDSLNEQFVKLSNESISERYAFVPARPNPVSYLTSNFLHGGWLHLIGNMWFLWLAGFILEDTWGRWLYLIFYLVAGAAAIQFHFLTNTGSIVPTLGASGAVAALMGAFLIRFPKIKIEMAFIVWWFIRIRVLKFKIAAYWLLPLWLLIEISSGKLYGNTSGTAHWAHVGGFLFGMIAATAIIRSGLERSINKVIEVKLGIDASETGKANELIEQGQLDEAMGILRRYVAANPNSLDGWDMIRRIYVNRQNASGFQEATLKTCVLRLKARDFEAAFQDYTEFINSGGEKMPPNVWLSLCKGAESMQKFELALTEYQKLAQKYPEDRQAFIARLNSARIYLKELNSPQDALDIYQAASEASIHYIDFESTIKSGIEEAKSAISGQAQMSQ